MARKKSTKKEAISFNVIYEDGTLSSNRRIPGNEFESAFEEETDVARRVIAAQDAKIAEMSGMMPRQIKSIVKVKS